ncbi:MAG: DUF6455 family protein [Chromatiales bacterium]|jgi:hypothetical protein
MTLYSLLGVLVLAALVFALAVGLPFAVLRNMARGEAYRRDLDSQVSRLRLSKMLDFLGIDHARYLHRVPVADIHAHMRRCDACETTDICDRTIAEPARRDASVEFCPNADSLTRTP